MFLRGFPYLCAKMRRPTRKLKSSSEPKTHPNLYDTKTLVPLPKGKDERVVVTSESTSPTNISSVGDTDGSGSDQGGVAAAVFGTSGGAFTREMYGMSNLYNSSGGSDQDSSSQRMGAVLNGSVAGSENWSSERGGDGSDNGSNGEVGDHHRLSYSPPSGAFAPAYASLTTTAGSDEGGTTSDSSGQKGGGSASSRTASANGNIPSSSNGNSSDGSSSLHLLTNTALRVALAADDGSNGRRGSSREEGSTSSDGVGSDTGTEPISEVVQRWAANGGASTKSKKRSYRHMTAEERIAARKNSTISVSSDSSDGRR